MALYYKTLFETKVFHEYYLTDPDGTNVFDKNAQNDRLTFLRERFLEGEPSVNEDLDYAIPTTAQRKFRDYRMRLVPTFGGFKVAIEVTPEALADGTTTYRPKVALEEDLAIPVLLLKRSSRIDAYTNARIVRETNAAFYFSNETYAGAKVYPFLSNAVPPLDAGHPYEQGELADHGANTIRAFYRDATNAVQWLDRNGSGYANETDRLLVPPAFYYSFGTAAQVTQAEFVLKNGGGDVVGDYSFSQSEHLRKVLISVRPEDVLTAPEASPGAQLVYTLEAAGNNGYPNKTLRLIFYRGAERIENILGLVHIKVRSTDSTFDLLNNGLLVTRKKPDGTYNPVHPIFEVRLRSRITFWRYINEKKKDFQNNLHTDQLELLSGRLISKEPRVLSHTPLYFRKADNSLYYLPNPPGETVQLEGDRLFSDIYVSESKDLFPSGP